MQVDWQIALLVLIQQMKTPVFDGVFTLVTMTAEETFFIVLAAWFMWCQNKRLAQRVGFAFLTSTVFNPTLKSLFAIERPIYADVLRYAAIGFWITAGAPWLFQRFGWGINSTATPVTAR